VNHNGSNSEDSTSSDGFSTRLDLFLKQSRIIPRRTIAREACDQGGIRVNGQVSKASRPVKVGDLIQLQQHKKVTTVEVLRIPNVAPGKKDAARLYRVVGVDSSPKTAARIED
jgi:ribosomal 50S subunit-recycling heat shock protein